MMLLLIRLACGIENYDEGEMPCALFRVITFADAFFS